MLEPLPGYALVELPKRYESGLETEKEKYEARSQGALIGMDLTGIDDTKKYTKLFGSTVFFTAFEDGEIINYNGDEYVFVPITALRGSLGEVRRENNAKA